MIDNIKKALGDCRSGYLYIRDHVSVENKSGIGYARCIASSEQALQDIATLKRDYVLIKVADVPKGLARYEHKTAGYQVQIASECADLLHKAIIKHGESNE